MIFNLHGEPLVSRIERGSFWDGPGLQNSIEFQAKIIMQARGAVHLHDEAMTRFLLKLRGRLGSGLKTALAFVFIERHGQYFSESAGRRQLSA